MMVTSEELHEALNFDPETGEFRWRKSRYLSKIGTVAGSITTHGYWSVSVKGRPYQAHRLAWFYVYGMWPKLELDHRNGDKTDNRIDNLREVTSSANHQNVSVAKSNNVTGVLGVSRHSRTGQFYARIRLHGRQVYLGYFKTAEEASAAYVQAKNELHPFWDQSNQSLKENKS